MEFRNHSPSTKLYVSQSNPPYEVYWMEFGPHSLFELSEVAVYFNHSRIEICIVTYQTGRLVTIVTELYICFFIFRIESDYFNVCDFRITALNFKMLFRFLRFLISQKMLNCKNMIIEDFSLSLLSRLYLRSSGLFLSLPFYPWRRESAHESGKFVSHTHRSP
jgi:hypothetical protein